MLVSKPSSSLACTSSDSHLCEGNGIELCIYLLISISSCIRCSLIFSLVKQVFSLLIRQWVACNILQVVGGLGYPDNDQLEMQLLVMAVALCIALHLFVTFRIDKLLLRLYTKNLSKIIGAPYLLLAKRVQHSSHKVLCIEKQEVLACQCVGWKEKKAVEALGACQMKVVRVESRRLHERFAHHILYDYMVALQVAPNVQIPNSAREGKTTSRYRHNSCMYRYTAAS